MFSILFVFFAKDIKIFLIVFLEIKLIFELKLVFEVEITEDKVTTFSVKVKVLRIIGEKL